MKVSAAMRRRFTSEFQRWGLRWNNIDSPASWEIFREDDSGFCGHFSELHRVGLDDQLAEAERDKRRLNAALLAALGESK